MKTVSVDLGSRSYDIIIGQGLVERAAEHIVSAVGTANCAIITDENVAAHHLAPLRESLAQQNMFAGEVILPAGEKTKSFANLEYVCAELLNLGIERGDLVIALGGGVIGDLTGFAASVLRRGVRFIQIPTSLLAQVDSSVGGKTGINMPHGKNLIGAFHQPNLVLVDTNTLKTLDERQLRAGYAEVVKYGLLGDAEFFSWLETNRPTIFAAHSPEQEAARIHAIETSCVAKANVVAEDEKEAGRRALLNLGHTFGHALEAWAGYSSRLLHGEAISIGMVLAYEYSERLKLCPNGEADRVAAHFKAANLPTKISDITGNDYPSADELMDLMAQDKKVKRGKMVFILARKIGDAFITEDVDPEDLKVFLASKTQIGT